MSRELYDAKDQDELDDLIEFETKRENPSLK